MFYVIGRSRGAAAARVFATAGVIAVFLIACGRVQEPQAEPSISGSFDGVVGRTLPESVPDWPDPVRAPEGAPNVIIWLLDDAGYAHFSPYGSLIETPTVERLATNGLTFTDFHSIPAVLARASCSACRPQSPFGRDGQSHHVGRRLPRLQRRYTEERGVDRADTARRGVRDFCNRQMGSNQADRSERRRPVR